MKKWVKRDWLMDARPVPCPSDDWVQVEYDDKPKPFEVGDRVCNKDGEPFASDVYSGLVDCVGDLSGFVYIETTEGGYTTMAPEDLQLCPPKPELDEWDVVGFRLPKKGELFWNACNGRMLEGIPLADSNCPCWILKRKDPGGDNYRRNSGEWEPGLGEAINIITSAFMRLMDKHNDTAKD